MVGGGSARESANPVPVSLNLGRLLRTLSDGNLGRRLREKGERKQRKETAVDRGRGREVIACE